MSTNLRLALALIAYALLALVAWRTMEADKIRLVTLVILGTLALRTIIHAARLKREAEEERSTQRSGQGLDTRRE